MGCVQVVLQSQCHTPFVIILACNSNSKRDRTHSLSDIARFVVYLIVRSVGKLEIRLKQP
ncbi:hypothetical protein Poly41_28870 [Novipirellula artificiosorum]|uniref:Uncharacterized protein n=1 Tax=Novipirellula artificiosorum TaxID=2528016 RepID=A0A5C6DSE9_9BACT|nr:hypothetical protein Poly41_28870 [Novipirellula artificiosorum]